MTGVGVRRGGGWILADVDWTVRTGERWVVLGPNGAGKSTLVGLAATELHPTSGVVEVLGEQLGRVDVFEVRPRIGLVTAAMSERIPLQERAQDAVVTASWAVTGRWREPYEQIDTDRARWLLDQLGAGHLAGRRYGTLSDGERKRVQIARALMTDPELLLLDEPVAALDLAAREELLVRLADLAADPGAPAMVMVTHHVEEIPVGTTHVLLLRAGRVTAVGPLDATMTAQRLGECFGLEVALASVDGRWSARAVRAARGERSDPGETEAGDLG
ncbi:MAG: ABC transporter ATP-binding protein [Actinomycetes bacterium]